jgi:hypothetical protein
MLKARCIEVSAILAAAAAIGVSGCERTASPPSSGKFQNAKFAVTESDVELHVVALDPDQVTLGEAIVKRTSLGREVTIKLGDYVAVHEPTEEGARSLTLPLPGKLAQTATLRDFVMDSHVAAPLRRWGVQFVDKASGGQSPGRAAPNASKEVPYFDNCTYGAPAGCDWTSCCEQGTDPAEELLCCGNAATRNYEDRYCFPECLGSDGSALPCQTTADCPAGCNEVCNASGHFCQHSFDCGNTGRFGCAPCLTIHYGSANCEVYVDPYYGTCAYSLCTPSGSSTPDCATFPCCDPAESCIMDPAGSFFCY